MEKQHWELQSHLNKARATAIVLLSGEEDILAVGRLGEEGICTVHVALQRYWLNDPHPSINRYVGLDLEGHFRLVFAKFLPDNVGLVGLVFPLQTPLIRIRQDMTHILRAIIEDHYKNLEGDLLLERSLQFDDKSFSNSEKAHSQTQMGWRPEQDKNPVQDENTTMPESFVDHSRKNEQKKANRGRRQLTFGVPLNHSHKTLPFVDAQERTGAETDAIPWQSIVERGSNSPHPGDDLNTLLTQNRPQFSKLDNRSPMKADLVDILHEDFEMRVDLPESDRFQLSEENIVKDGEDLVGEVVIEELSPIPPSALGEEWHEQIADITFYLVPLRDEHFLIGNLSQRVRLLLPAICQKYGWELIGLSVRPNYVKWTLSDFPESLIREMLHLVRKETSRQIFNVFPELGPAGQETDYWSPGYLVDMQHREFTTQAVMAHVGRTCLSGEKIK